MNKIDKKYNDSIYASIVGDALGVPVEFSTRQELALCAVKNMLGYGRYDLPKGTWSDDSSMILTTMDTLISGYSQKKLADAFCDWLFDGKWTPCGYAFDSGITTFTALDNIRSGAKTVDEAGQGSEDDNGNGSLMRMLPVALYYANLNTDDFLDKVHEISSITHTHPRALVGCGIFSLLIKELTTATDKAKALNDAINIAVEYYSANDKFKEELNSYIRIISDELIELTEDDIYSSGYIVHTLEAAIWSFINADNTKDILLKAVNLGLDTDTTGTVAGGLAGLFYGIDSIPSEWIETLSKKEDIKKITKDFIVAIEKKDS